MKEILLVKYGEIILKGGNRSRFEKILIENMHNVVNKKRLFLTSLYTFIIYCCQILADG